MLNWDTKKFAILLVVFVVVLLLPQVFKTNTPANEREISFSEFMHDLEQGKIAYVTLYRDGVVRTELRNDNRPLRTTVPSDYNLTRTLLEKEVVINVASASESQWVNILLNSSPFLLLIVFWIFMVGQMGFAGTKTLKRHGYSCLDRTLIQSSKRLAQPDESLSARMSLANNQIIEGKIIWADSNYIKCQTSSGGPESIVSKGSILKFEVLPQV